MAVVQRDYKERHDPIPKRPNDLDKALAEIHVLGIASQERDELLMNEIYIVRLALRTLLQKLALERPDFIEQLAGSVEGVPVDARDAVVREIRKAAQQTE